MVAPGDAHRGAVAVHELAHLGRGQEDRISRFIWNQKPMTVRVPFDAPGDERDALRDEQAAGAVPHHVAGALERRERALELAPCVASDVQARGQLVRGQRRARGVENGQDALPVGRVPVASTPSSQRGSFGFFL